MDALAYFHFALATSYFTYYFKFSEVNGDFFDKCAQKLREFKTKLTGEIATEIQNLASPTPKIIVAVPGQAIDYQEEQSNPLKGEKFKNWLDGYLEKEFSAIRFYDNFGELYLKWKNTWLFVRKYSIVFSIFEILFGVAAFVLLKINDDAKKALLDNHQFVTALNICLCLAFISSALLIFLIIKLYYANELHRKLIGELDDKNGL